MMTRLLALLLTTLCLAGCSDAVPAAFGQMLGLDGGPAADAAPDAAPQDAAADSHDCPPGEVPLPGIWDAFWHADDLTIADGARVLDWPPREGTEHAVAPDDTTAPTLTETGFFGQQAVSFDDSLLQRMRADGLAGLYAGDDKPVTIVAIAKPTAGTSSVVVIGDSTTGAYHHAHLKANTAITLYRSSGPAADTTYPAGLGKGFIDGGRSLFAWVFDGRAVQTCHDWTCDIIKVADVDPMPADRVLIGAFIANNGVVQTTFKGELRALGITRHVLTEDDLQTIWDSFFRREGKIAFMGDSLTWGANGSGGFRRRVWDTCATYDFACEIIGSLDDGIHWPHTLHDAHQGKNSGTISVATYALRKFYGPGKLQPDLLALTIGTNDANDEGGAYYSQTGTPAAYASLLEEMHALLPGTKIAVTTIPTMNPLGPSAGQINANIDHYNAALPAIWDSYDAAHEPDLIRWGFGEALGAWSSTNYGSDHVHPNQTGYDHAAYDATYGLVQAILPTLAAW